MDTSFAARLKDDTFCKQQASLFNFNFEASKKKKVKEELEETKPIITEGRKILEPPPKTKAHGKENSGKGGWLKENKEVIFTKAVRNKKVQVTVKDEQDEDEEVSVTKAVRKNRKMLAVRNKKVQVIVKDEKDEDEEVSVTKVVRKNRKMLAVRNKKVQVTVKDEKDEDEEVSVTKAVRKNRKMLAVRNKKVQVPVKVEDEEVSVTKAVRKKPKLQTVRNKKKNNKGEAELAEKVPPTPIKRQEEKEPFFDSSFSSLWSSDEGEDEDFSVTIDKDERDYLSLRNSQVTGNNVTIESRHMNNCVRYMKEEDAKYKNIFPGVQIAGDASTETYSSGYLKILPRTVKPLELTGNVTVNYFVITGSVMLRSTTYNTKNDKHFLCGKSLTVGAHIMVPPFTPYTLENRDDSQEAVLGYFIVNSDNANPPSVSTLCLDGNGKLV